MSISKKITILLISFILFQKALGQQLILDGKWKYTLTDDPRYSNASFDDTGWKERSGNNLLLTREDLQTDSRYAWFREKVIIPSTLKTGLATTGALSVFLGRLFQTDEVFFNGKIIGKTNSSDVKRAYLINPDLIMWDKENTIAIRIRHWGDRAGLEISPPYIGPAVPAKVFELHSAASGVSNKMPVKYQNGEYQCIISNHSTLATAAHINVRFFDITDRLLAHYDRDTILAPGNQYVIFPYRAGTSFLKVVYTLTIPKFAYSATWNDEFGYEENPYHPANPMISDRVTDNFVSPGFEQVVIMGWLGKRMEANEEQRLFNVDEDAILSGYINRPGDHPWIGEHAGKFLDAASNTYKNSHSGQLKIQMDRIAQKLIAAQLSNGYLGTYTSDNYWTSWDVWSHKYSIIGLLSYYSVSGYKPALLSARKAGDLLCRTFGSKKGQLDIVKAGAHVGMAATSVLEPMVELYRYTGDKKYLDFCMYVVKSFDEKDGPKIISTLDSTGRVDKTANSKAYEMLSNLLGIIKLYKITGDTKFLKPVMLAWQDIVNKRLYITGTASSFEHFKDDYDLPASDKDNMGEGCVTTTWVQLNYQLLCIYGELKYVNELERSVYNHLTGAENPESGCVSYYTPLMGIKPYRCVITCCMSSVPRGISLIPLFTNGKINDQPSFLFYQAGSYTATLKENKKITFTTVTDFPSTGDIKINVRTDAALNMPVLFRKPYWAANFNMEINGKRQIIPAGELVKIKRIWKTGDQVVIHFDMPVRLLNGGKSYPNQVALQRGPQILAVDDNLNDIPADKIRIDKAHLTVSPESIVLPREWIGSEAFRLKAILDHAEKDIILVPYADASQTGGIVTTWLKKNEK